MTERSLETTCPDCGRPFSFHGERAPRRCDECFDGFLRARDADFLSSYAELGVTSRRVIAETALRALVMDNPRHRKVLAMHIVEQYVHAAGDLIGLYNALKERGREPVMRAFLGFKLDRDAALAFFRDVAEHSPEDLLTALGLPLPDDVRARLPSLSRRDAKDLAGAIHEMVENLQRTAGAGESAALALAQMAGESLGGGALTQQSAWLDNVGLRADQVAALVVDEQRRTVNITAFSVDEKKLQTIVSTINYMTRAAENLIYAVLSMEQEERRSRERAAAPDARPAKRRVQAHPVPATDP